MKDAGGFCLPDFVKRGVNIWFAIDNIDLLEDTPTGQETFHGTVIVINQKADNGEPINEPLLIPEKIPSQAPLKFEVKLQQEPIITTTPLRFEVFKMEKRNNLLSKDFTHTRALANYLATDDYNRDITLVERQLAQEKTADNEENLRSTESSNEGDHSDFILSAVRGQMHKPNKLAKM